MTPDGPPEFPGWAGPGACKPLLRVRGRDVNEGGPAGGPVGGTVTLWLPTGRHRDLPLRPVIPAQSTSCDARHYTGKR